MLSSLEKRFATVLSLVPRRRQSAAWLWVAGNEGEAPSSRLLRPPCPVHPVTAILKYGPADVLRTTTLYEETFAARAIIVVDLGLATFDHTTVGGHALQDGQEVRERTAPVLSSHVLTGLLPPCRLYVSKVRVPLWDYCSHPARFILSRRYPSTAPQRHSGRQLHTKKCLPPAPNSS